MQPIPTYQQCMDLVNSRDCFRWKVETVDNVPIFSFSYKLGNYSDFCCDYARELRGITFDSDRHLIALPFWKFFNYNENPFTSADLVNSWKIKTISCKYDGSLIYFYMLNGKIHAKTKLSCNSIFVSAAEEMMKQYGLEEFIRSEILYHRTPMFEYIGPDNQIVLPYNKRDLIFLGSRDMITGEYYNPIKLYSSLPPGMSVPDIYHFGSSPDIREYCNVSNQIEEGYVVEYENGELVKFKTSKYIDLSHIINNISVGSTLAEIILKDKVDDIINIIPEGYRESIISFQEKIIPHYNHLIREGLDFYTESKGLIRKDYALKAINNFGDSLSFYTAMDCYLDRFSEDTLKEKYLKHKMWENIVSA